MGVLVEPRLERLAQELARGQTVVEASKCAGYKPGSSFAHNARKRAQRKDVKARVLELQTISGVLAAVDAAYLQRKAQEIVEVPLDPDVVSTADRLKAMDFLAKLKGLYAPTSVAVSGPDGGPIETKEISELDAVRRINFLLRKAANAHPKEKP